MSSVQQVARLLGVTSVERLCKKFVRTGLTPANCMTRYSLADSFLGWQDTATTIETFLQLNFSRLVREQREEFCSRLTEVQLTRLLSSPDLQLESEDEVAEAALAWVEFDPERRTECLAPLLDCVQHQCLSGPQAVLGLLDNPAVSRDSHCVQLLQQALAYHNLSYQDKISYWADQAKPSRWPKLLVCLSYAEKILEYYDFSSGECGLLTEKPDWVFGAELVSCGGALFTIGGVSSRQVDR